MSSISFVSNATSLVLTPHTTDQNSLSPDQLLRIKTVLMESYSQDGSPTNTTVPEYHFSFGDELWAAWFNKIYGIVVIMPQKDAWRNKVSQKTTLNIDDQGKIVEMRFANNPKCQLSSDQKQLLQALYTAMTANLVIECSFPFDGKCVQKIIDHVIQVRSHPLQAIIRADLWLTVVHNLEGRPHVTQLCTQIPRTDFEQDPVMCIIEMEGDKIVGLQWRGAYVKSLELTILEQYFIKVYNAIFPKEPIAVPVQSQPPTVPSQMASTLQQPISTNNIPAGQQASGLRHSTGKTDAAATQPWPGKSWGILYAGALDYQEKNKTTQVPIIADGVKYHIAIARGDKVSAVNITSTPVAGTRAELILTGAFEVAGGQCTAQMVQGYGEYGCKVQDEEGTTLCSPALQALIIKLAAAIQKKA